MFFAKWVRLVRACGSKLHWYLRCWTLPPVRLVRACGSKLFDIVILGEQDGGQARKSLWIETSKSSPNLVDMSGQARKSLWIETGIRLQD